jgi:hypothetical protein
MAIVALDLVEQCYSAEDGLVIQVALREAFSEHGSAVLSFSGVSDVPSSFINAALVPFVLEEGLDWLKKRLSIIGARKQVAEMIFRCFENAQHPQEAA